MRYSGGLLGGSWLTALASDLGHGKFDGAWLVQNFENQNPANTLWTKQYNLYSKIDTEAPRYLGFERWWGGHVNLNAEEIQSIVDELFVGNKLAAGEIRTPTARRSTCATSARRSSCSARRATTSRRRSRRSAGFSISTKTSTTSARMARPSSTRSTKSVGHLGIFVSGGVARKEHGEFSSNIDLIDVLPPGLYEAVFEAKTDGDGESRPRLGRLGDALRGRGPSTTSARSAATMRPTSAGLPPRRACRRSISRSIAPSPSRSCGP